MAPLNIGHIQLLRMSEIRKIAIFAHSGDYDRIHQLTSIVTAAASSGMEVHIFFSFWALMQLVKGQMDKIRLQDQHIQFKKNFENKISEGKIYPVSKMLKMVRKIGIVKIYACSASMAILDIKQDDLSEEVDNVMGLVTFISIAEDAKMTLYL